MSKFPFSSTRLGVALRIGVCAGLAVGFAGGSSALHAQALSGMTGTATDAAGLAVDGVEVAATNDATGVVSTAITNSAGVYTMADLTPGTYTVRFLKAGFQSTVHTGVRIEVSRRTDVSATLQPSSIEETVEVVTPLVSLETNQPEVGWTLEKKVLEELPVVFGADNGDRARQIESSLFLVPGVSGDAFSHRINGGADMQNEVIFDGVPVAWGETQGRQTIINPPYEMIQEFRVVSSTFSAQYGLGQGAVTYKFASGANTFHGSAFGILRNEALNAVGHTPLEEGKADRDRRQNFGGSFGGPVHIPGAYDGRDRTFFYASVDLYRVNQPVNARMSLPTAAMKAGDFSAYPRTIYVPNARFLVPGCTPGAAAGQPFPGNRIPQNCLSNTTKGILPLIPDPTDPGFVKNAPSLITDTPTDQNNWGVSLDHRIGSNQSVRFNFWRNKYDVQRETNDAYFTNEIAGSFFEPQLGTGVVATYSNVLSPSLIMTAGFGYLRERNDQINKNLGRPFPGVVDSEAFPVIRFQGNLSPTDLGTSGGLTTSINNKLGLSFVNNWLYTRGRHTWNAGFVVKRASQESQECQQCAGTFRFSSDTTADATNLDNTGSAFASFLLGVVNSADRAFTPPKFFTNLSVSPYIQDEFRIAPRLTLSAGLRWDIMRPFTERDDRVVFMDPNLPNPEAIDPRTGQPLLGAITKLGTCEGCAGYRRASVDWTQISPRLGAVFQLSPKTVLSAGAAVNRLNGGTYEFGTSKVGNTYSSLLVGEYASLTPNQTIPGYGQWDGNPMPAPAAPPFGPTIANGLSPASFTTDGRAPYVVSWTAGVQRELPWNLLVTANYVGNRALHLPSFRNPPNQLNPMFLDLCPDPGNCVLLSPWTSAQAQAALQSLGFGQWEGYFTPYRDFINDKGPSASLQQALRPFPQYFGFRNNFETNGRSDYNSLQTSLQRRFGDGLGFMVAYTLSKVLQSGDDSGFSTFNGQPINQFNPGAEWAVGNGDRRHNLVISGVYELPIRPTGSLAKNLIGGWQVSGSFFYRSGSPLGIGTGGSNSPLLGGNRANWDQSVPLNVDWGKARDAYRSPDKNDGTIMFPGPLPGEATPFDIFNVAAFSSPGRARIGDSPRRLNGLRGPWSTSENLSLAKRLYIGHGAEAQLRFEFFNLFNRQGYCDIGTNVEDRDAFGLSNARRIRDSQGRVIGIQVQECQGQTPRRGQVFLKFTF